MNDRQLMDSFAVAVVINLRKWNTPRGEHRSGPDRLGTGRGSGRDSTMKEAHSSTQAHLGRPACFNRREFVTEY